MVRSITLTKPPLQPQKVNATANAEQIARLEAQAAKLREQIRLANRMGERDWAAQARQELAQVTTQLSSLQPAQVAAPAAPALNASTGTSGNGTTVTPALYVRTDLAAPTLMSVKLDGSKPEDNAAEATTARNIVNDVTGGKSIDQIASARGMTRDQVIAALRSGGMTVSTTNPTSDNGDVQATKITDASGHTVTQYYDYQHDSYYTSVEQPNGTATTTPIRDGLGRKETSSRDPDTGAITTRYEDDLGTGTVTERTSLPNGASVETVTPGAGPSLPVTTVTGPDGHKTILAYRQDPGGKSTQTIKEGLADGKSIEQIAQENGLTSEQVIAELQAAGYQVKTSSNSDVQSVEIVEAHTGDKTVYSHDYQHDTRTVVTTADGKETSRSVDGNGGTRSSVRNTKTGETTTTTADPKTGTETKTVTDKDGRVTTTTTEKINGGKPVEYEVKPGDNLTLIAQQYGMTLDDLRRTNPELFSSHRDPDILHTGEKITIENGTRTTVEVAFNGYTLTTKPDGSMTLHNNTTGTDLKIEAGSTQAALARTLLAVNPNSSNSEEAREGQVVKTFVEGLLAGETLPSLINAAEKAGQDKQALIDKYGLGTAAKPKLDGQNRVVDPFGDPPRGNAPSGGKWTPMKIDGVWTWVDPQVAQAIITENIALSRITETRALAVQQQEQLNVDMLDPACKDAVDGAQTIINKALAPLGLQWAAQKPKGTLADAGERLTKANTLLQNARDARGEYENAGRVLGDAIAQQRELKPLIDPNAQAFTSTDKPAPDRQTEYAQGLADHAAVDKLFSEVGLHLGKGDKLTIDFLVGQAELDGVPTDSKEYKDLKALQTTAGNQLELAQAYQNYFGAHADATQVGAQQADLEHRLLVEYLGQKKFDPNEKYNRYSGDYLGHYKTSTIEIRDGQVWVVSHFDKGTTEQQLTYNPSDKNIKGEYRDRQLNKEWQQFLGGTSSAMKVCTANAPVAARASEAQAAKDLNDVLDRQLGNSITDLKTTLTTLQTNFNNALTQHGPGTVDAPKGTLPDGVQPVEINVGGQTIKVAPEVAQKYNQIGIDALTQGGKAIWIDLDTQDDDHSGRWVDPELAVSKLKLEATRAQITQAEDLRRVVQGFSDYHELRLSDPSLLADRNSTVDKTYLDEHQQQTLDGIYEPKFQQLLDSGYDNEFREQRGTALDDTVARTLGLDRSTDEGRGAIDNVTEEIRDIGGDNPYVRSVPIFYVDDEVGTQQVTLFAVRDGDGNTRYVDVTGKKFDNLGDFQDNNSQFGENGKLVVPKGLEMKAGDDGKIALEVVKSRNVSVWDKVVDPLVGIGTGIATILSFTPAAPIAAPLAYTGAAYLGTRAVINQVNHLEHGGEWDDRESLMNIASAATTVLPMASSGLRTIGLAGKEMTALQAFRGSIGATRSGSSLALETRSYMQSTAGLNKAAWGMDVGSVIVGAPLLATSAYDLAVNGDQMNGLQLANALTGLGTGITGTGLGIHGLRTLRPGTGTQASSKRRVHEGLAYTPYAQAGGSSDAVGHGETWRCQNAPATSSRQGQWTAANIAARAQLGRKDTFIPLGVSDSRFF
ncbi:LysM peptidoglycan-binding domain-containing protein [Mesorhizobium calcicola]|uniref:LysM peptidoglycan-binding domain-containing protein n=1 Tax=Mesorhizobium calcicola TaxID=1300310 RepID=A0ABW4WLJ6_9HYPH